MLNDTDSVEWEIQRNSLYFVYNVDHQNPNVTVDLRLQPINFYKQAQSEIFALALFINYYSITATFCMIDYTAKKLALHLFLHACTNNEVSC